MAKKKFIKDAIKKPGALRKTLGVKKGKKVPVGKVKKELRKLHKKVEAGKKLTPAELKKQRRENFFANVLKPASKKNKKAEESFLPQIDSLLIEMRDTLLD